MPLLRCWKSEGADFAVWQVTESAVELRGRLPAQGPYDEELAQFRSAGRRLEYLAVRVLLQELMGGDPPLVAHLPSGKPCLADGSRHITVSHTAGYVAVGLHPVAEVGIDIERIGERVRKVRSRFVRDDEIPGFEALPAGEQLVQLLLHWSAKETLFKLMDVPGVDFVRHLRVLPFRLRPEGEMEAFESRTSRCLGYRLRYFVHPDFVCVYGLCP